MMKTRDEIVLDDMRKAMRHERAMHGYIPFDDRDLPYGRFTDKYPEIQKLDKKHGLSGGAFMVLWRYAWYSITAPKYKLTFCVLTVLSLLIALGAK